MEFSRQEYWSGQLFPSPGDLLDPGIKPRSPALQADSLVSEPPGEPKEYVCTCRKDCCCSVTQSCLTLCSTVDCSIPGFPVPLCLPEFEQTHVHWVDDAIQPSHPFFSCPHSFPASGSAKWVEMTEMLSIGVYGLGFPQLTDKCPLPRPSRPHTVRGVCVCLSLFLGD